MAKFEKQLFTPPPKKKTKKKKTTTKKKQQKNFWAWHFFMHMLNISMLLMQRIRKLQ